LVANKNDSQYDPGRHIRENTNVSIQDFALGLQGFARRRVAIAVSLALGAAAAHAQTAPQTSAEEAKTLPKVSVAAPEEETINVKQVASPKFTQALVDTPQTIAVISDEVLLQQGATTLSQALRNTPGVTFLLGENGNTATGDSIFMRGFDTQGSIFIDGIRDLGTVSRDTFNTEQVEIAKGPAGPDYGRGAASGYVNLVSKVPANESFARGTASYGTASNGRVTGDINHAFEGTGTAFRLNAMYQDGEVDGRDFIERKGWAVAPSLAFGLDGDTRSYFYLLHTEQDNVPDGGVTTIGLDGWYDTEFDPAIPTAPNRGVVPNPVDRENYYGYANDFEQISGTMFTARFEHDFSDTFTVRNSTRVGRIEQFYVLTGVNAVNGPTSDPSAWTVNRTRQSKFQENTLLTNQTNFTYSATSGGVSHSLTGGVEFINEEQYNPAYTAASLGTLVPANVYNPGLIAAPPGYAPVRNGAFTRGETQTIGAYVFDTLSFAERWQVTGGFRMDTFDTDFESMVATVAGTTTTLTPVNLQTDDTLFSYKLGVLYKPTENGSVYISHATSRQPPGGANFTLTTTANNVNRFDLEPTEGANLELGVKWEFREGALAVTGALFDSTSKNELVQDATDPNVFVQVGEREIKGIELGLVGNVTDDWELSAGIAKMDSEVVRGNPNQTGSQINWSPEFTFTTWSTYTTPFGLQIGGGVRYVDTVARSINITDPLVTNVPTAPEYWVIDAMLAYEVNDKVTLQLNAYNLADEEYVGTLNNGGSRYIPGAPLSALFTVNFSF
jgi:catecholate siderophore receptor